ncbi:TPA: hypothetical protein DD449_00075 [Candidatus Berkelbacteria bacterium]|uniref:Uncharacterized protein n=1 Tax=Berkelbacteria bacterium GW2011_GWE1_39_12 TaxID=1618337 RepID=A0A0G4B4A7_9BACT|nr:MAG: hypothetical protein UT28_C0001G0003 [Berkelbacteria bacterium GW2011_GWE1_39_12]HBO60071.1 hypothetical protein [Candidatus Berkelbacteria bacterium]
MHNDRIIINDRVVKGTKEGYLRGLGKDDFIHAPLSAVLPAMAFMRMLNGTLEDLCIEAKTMEMDWVRHPIHTDILQARLHLVFSEVPCTNGVGIYGSPQGITTEIWVINDNNSPQYSFDMYVGSFIEGIERRLLELSANFGPLAKICFMIKQNLPHRTASLHVESIEKFPFKDEVETILRYRTSRAG